MRVGGLASAVAVIGLALFLAWKDRRSSAGGSRLQRPTPRKDFNVRYRVGKEAEIPSRQAQVSFGQDTLRVAVREDYCWMWSNKTSSRAGEWPEPSTRYNDERHVADVFTSLAAY